MNIINLSFTEEHQRTLNEALMQLPYWKAAPLIAEINRQLQEQQKHEADKVGQIKD